MTTPISTIMNNVNVILVDSSTITPATPYIVYISSVSIPGRVATVRDATGYLSSPNKIIVSTLKDILISPNISTFTITQAYGYITLSSRDSNTWNIVNTFAFPDPQGTANVSSLYVNAGINASTLFTTAYISTPYVNTYSISSFNLVASNAISSAYLQANTISTNTLLSYGAIKSDRLNVSTISSYYNYNNYISVGSISSGSIAVSLLSSGLLIGSSLSTNNIATNFISSGLLTVNSISSVNTYGSVVTGASILANTISSGLLTVNSISSVNINASVVSSILVAGSSISSINNATSTIVANFISSGLLRANNISSLNINASVISSALFIGSSVSTNNLAVNTLSSGVINAGNINGTIISSSLFIGTSVSTNAIAANTISTGAIALNSLSTVNIQATNVSSISLFANNLLATNISSITAKTSSMTVSSIIIQSGTVAGKLSASSDGTLLLFNSASVGAWNGTATTALSMNGFPINASNINVSSLNNSINVNTSNLAGIGRINLFRASFYNPSDNAYINLSNSAGFLSYSYGSSNVAGFTPVASDWWRYAPSGTVNINNNILSNVNTIYIKNGVTQGSLTVNSDGDNLLFNGSPLAGGWVPTAASDLNMNSHSISNITTNYKYTFSNTNTVPSVIAAAPQTFCAAIYDQNFGGGYTLVTTGNESNYLYFEPGQYMWNINITVYGTIHSDTPDTVMNNYFTLSNSANHVEVPLTLYNSNRISCTPISESIVHGLYYTSFSFSDTVNLSKLLTDMSGNKAEIKLNMYSDSPSRNNFSNANIGVWNLTTGGFFTGTKAVAFGNNTFIAGGASSGISASYDNGKTWFGPIDIGFDVYAIAYGNGKWIFGTNTGNGIYYSTDLTDFPAADFNHTGGFSDQCFSIAYGTSGTIGTTTIFVAVGSDNNYKNIWYSYNGIQWFSSPSTFLVGLCSRAQVTYGNGHFVAVFNRSTANQNIYKSSDGVNWTQITGTGILKGFTIAYGNNNWLLCGENISATSLYSSTDLNTWTEIVGASNLSGFIIYGDTLLGGSGSNGSGEIFQSLDNGTTWSGIDNTLTSANVAAYGNGTYIVAGVGTSCNDYNIVTNTGANTVYFTLQPTAFQPVIPN